MPDPDLQALAAQYDAEDAEEVVLIEEVEEIKEEVDLEESEVIEEVEEEGNPPGFIDNLDDWVAAGKHPDDFRGKKAYKAEYDRIQQVKNLENSFKTMQETLKSTVDAVAKREEITHEQHKKELEAALATAKDDDDVDAALDAAEKLNDINSAPKQRAENPVIGDFFNNNPALESPEIKSEFARIYNGKLKNDGVTPDEQLSQAALKGYLKASMDSVKAIYPDKFVSPKINRQTAPKIKAKPARVKVNVEDALSKYKVDGASSKNSGAPLGVYRMLKESAGDEAAKNFAESVLGVKL